MADLTKAEALRMFGGYTNYSIPVMRKFVDLFFSVIGGSGDLDIPDPRRIRFYNSSKTQLYSWMQQNGFITFWNTNQAGASIQVFAHDTASLGGALKSYFGRTGGEIGFFAGTSSAVQQTVVKTLMVEPTDLPTALAQIVVLQNVVISLRTGVLNYHLFN